MCSYWHRSLENINRTAASQGDLQPVHGDEQAIVPPAIWAFELRPPDDEPLRLEVTQMEVRRLKPDEIPLVVDDDEVIQGPASDGQQPLTRVPVMLPPVQMSPLQYVQDLHKRHKAGTYHGPLPVIKYIPGLVRRCPPSYKDGRERRAKFLDPRTMCAILTDGPQKPRKQKNR